MAITIADLVIDPGKEEDQWTVNISSNDVSTATDIQAANVDHQHGIESITVTGVSAGTEWFRIMDGEDTLIGPVIMATGVPWTHTFKRTIYCTRGNALKIKTESAISIHAVIEGATGVPVVSSSPSASPSATE